MIDKPKTFNRMVIRMTFPADKWVGQDWWMRGAELVAALATRLASEDSKYGLHIRRSTVSEADEILEEE